MHRQRTEEPDAGFSLLEALVGILMLTVAVASAFPLVVRVLQDTAELDARRTSITLASERLEQVRGVRPSQLIAGRHAADVAALIAAPGLVDLSGDVTSAGNSDPAASVGSSAATVPVSQQQSVRGVSYTLRTYVDRCYLSTSDGSCTADPQNGTRAWRVTVDVGWPRAEGGHCPSGLPGLCEHVATTLVDPSNDPVFSAESPPRVLSLLDTRTTPAATLGVVHPGQLVPLRVLGADLAPGANVYSADRDAVGQPTNNTGTSLDVPLQVSSMLGRRSLVVVNPSGASSSASFDVTTSAPDLSSVSPTSVPGGTLVTFTLTGSDLLATPSLATQTAKPAISLYGVAVINGAPYNGTSPVTSINVVSPTSVTFRSAVPFGNYTATVTITLTNPDGGTVSRNFVVNVT